MVKPVRFKFGPCGVYNKRFDVQLVSSGRESAMLDQHRQLQAIVHIPDSRITAVNFHQLFYPVFKKAQFDDKVLAQNGVIVVHIDAHSDLAEAKTPKTPANSFSRAVAYMNKNLSESNFLTPLVSEPTVDAILLIGCGNSDGLAKVRTVSMTDFPRIVTELLKDREQKERHLAFSIDLDCFVEKDYEDRPEPEWNEWRGMSFIRFKFVKRLWGLFEQSIQQLNEMGIDSNCKVIATSTHTPTSLLDDHFQYMPVDLAGFLLPQAVDIMTKKRPQT